MVIKATYLFNGYLVWYSPAASSLWIALNAVGAVNIAATSWSCITLKNALGSGVPTGLPCKNNIIVVINADKTYISSLTNNENTTKAQSCRV